MPMRNLSGSSATAAATPPPANQASESGAAVDLPRTGFIRQRQVLALVPISKSTLWRQVKARSFPSPVKLSARVTAWRAEDVRRWIADHSGG